MATRGERLAHIVLVQVRELRDDLCSSHPVGHEVHHMRDRDTKSADGRSAGEYLRVLRDAIEGVFHGCPWLDCSPPRNDRGRISRASACH